MGKKRKFNNPEKTVPEKITILPPILLLSGYYLSIFVTAKQKPDIRSERTNG